MVIGDREIPEQAYRTHAIARDHTASVWFKVDTNVADNPRHLPSAVITWTTPNRVPLMITPYLSTRQAERAHTTLERFGWPVTAIGAPDPSGPHP